MGKLGWRRAIALALLIGLAAGCGDDDDGEGGASSTIEAGTAEQSSSSTTTTGSTTTTRDGELADEPPLTGDTVSGSGCSPGDELSDGWWYGTLDGAVTSEVTFDLACYYTGAAAQEVAAARSDEVNNDYYVVNDNSQLRTVTVRPDATASCVEVGSAAGTADCALGDVGGDWAVWLRVQDGEVDRIVEQYAP